MVFMMSNYTLEEIQEILCSRNLYAYYTMIAIDQS